MSRYSPQTEGIRLRRIGAFLIDIGPLWLLVALMPDATVFGLGLVPIFLFYRACFVLAGRPTFGKRALGLTVETRSGSRPGRARLLWRDLPFATAYLAARAVELAIDRDPEATITQEIGPAVILLYVIGFAFWDLVVAMITSSRAIHDFWAGTRVVGSPASWEVAPRQPTSP